MYRYHGLGKKIPTDQAINAGLTVGATAFLGPAGGMAAGAISPLVSSAFGSSGPSGPGLFERMRMARDAKLRAQEADAAARLTAAQGERGKVLKYSLFGIGGLLLAGALTLWILARRKKGTV